MVVDNLGALLICLIESPSLVSIINWEDHWTVPIEYFKHGRELLSNCKVSIKWLDVILIFIEAVSVVDFNYLMWSYCSWLIDMKIDLESMEVARDNDHLSLPVVMSSIVGLFVNSYCCEEGCVWKRDMNTNQLFS